MDTSVMIWPRGTREELEAFYGKHELGPEGLPTQKWIEDHLVLISTPFPLRLSWDTDITVRRVRCHRKVATSLGRVFQTILNHYGSPKAIAAARADLFGGCYEFRRISGSHVLSLHAWGAAVDLDPQQNPRGRVWVDGTGMMPRPVISAFEAEGWAWGGRFKAKPVTMHFAGVSR
jgi:hypothetical protein